MFPSHSKKRFIPRLAPILTFFYLFALSGCANHQPLITISPPKIYGDDQTLKAFAERRKNLAVLTKSIKANEINEIFGVQQATQTDISAAISPTAGELLAAPEPLNTEKIALPSLSKSQNIGRSYSSLLRDSIIRDQDLLGWDLYYLGDNHFFEEDATLALMRFDVSINNFLNGETLFAGNRKFAIAGFKVTAENCESSFAYALAPDYSATISQDSIVTSTLENFALQGVGTTGNIDISGAGRFQRVLQESLNKIVEHPLQFAIYQQKPEKNSAAFGYAFGPKRSIIKRSWFNPKRWFGNTYRIKYLIEPGPRAVWALLVFQGCQSDPINLSVEAKIQPDLLIEGEKDQQKFQAIFFGSKDGLGSARGSVQSTQDELGSKPSLVTTETIEVPVQSQQETSESRAEAEGRRGQADASKGIINYIFDELKLKKVSEPSKVIEDLKIYPDFPNTLLIRTPYIVSGNTEVEIGPEIISQENISVLGRYTLKLNFPPNKKLSALLDKIMSDNPGQTPTVDVTLLTPGQEPHILQGKAALIKFKNETSKPNPISYKLIPAEGMGNEEIKIVAEQRPKPITSQNFKNIKVIKFGDQLVNPLTFPKPSDNEIFVKVPEGSASILGSEVSLVLEFNDGGKPLHLFRAFKYKEPSKNIDGKLKVGF